MAELTMKADEMNHPPVDEHKGGLLVVGLFKLSKAVFFGAVGVGALDLVHKDLGDLVMRMLEALRVDQEGRLVSLIMDKTDLIGHHQLREAGMFSLLYAVLCLVEGVGLVTRRSWAEYFTVILTAAALPWETYELLARFQPYKIGLLLVNLAVLVYLLWVLKRKKVEEQEQAVGNRE